MDQNTIYEIAFSMAKGMLGATALEMLRRVGSAEALFTYSASQLQTLAGVNSEIFRDDYRRDLLSHATQEAQFLEAHGIRPLFISHQDYPQRMVDCEDAPALLYSYGCLNLNSPYLVGVVGTRHATPYGIDFTTHLVTDLAAKLPGVIIVSGLAFGIDIAAHKAAMAAGTPTIAVVAHGFDTIYPAEHRAYAGKIANGCGALLTEYPSGSRMHRSSFLARNRIVAGLCDCIVVVESDVKGGSMSTARLARDYNREVFAVPGRVNDIYSRGTNRLIAQNKAQLITGADDLMAAMMWQPAEKASADEPPALFRALTADEQSVYDFICGHPDATENDMCVNLSMPFSKVSNIVFTLEMEDFIIKVPGGRYMPGTR